MKSKYLFFFLFSLFTFSAFSQNAATTPTGDSKAAKDNFTFLNYKDALIEYQAFFLKDSTNPEYIYKLGVCYLQTKKDINNALRLLLKASKDSKLDPVVWYYLGQAYQQLLKYNEAIEAFTKYKNDPKSKDDQAYTAKRQIEMCKNAIELLKKPVNVSFENLGKEVNSEAPDFNPYITPDESQLVYTSRRDKNTGRTPDYDGHFTADVYMITPKNGQFVKTRNMGGLINTELVEEVVGVGGNGDFLYLYYDNYQGLGDLFFSAKKGKSYTKSAPLASINSKDMETAASSNQNNTMIVFSSDQQGGKGETDLWLSRILPNGEWGPAENISEINTEEDESFPSFSPDGKTLYFASSGHNSMGGYDIFKTAYNDSTKKWAKPINLGYPINNSDDNTVISFAKNPRYAYIAACRPEGIGYSDIYRITFNDLPPSYTLVQGNVILPDSTNLYTSGNFIPPSPPVAAPVVSPKSKSKTAPKVAEVKPVETPKIDVVINVQKKSDKTPIGIYRPNPRTGKYMMNLPTGEYVVILSGNGLQTCTDEIIIPEKDLYKENINKPLIIRKLEVVEPTETQ
ncbi:MAG: CDC27 family protein [Bacteroidota bacterium]